MQSGAACPKSATLFSPVAGLCFQAQPLQLEPYNHRVMQAQEQRIGDRIGLFLTPDEAKALNLSEGDIVKVQKAERYAMTEEALSANRRTERRFADAYTEFAK